MTEGLYFTINMYFVGCHLSIKGNLTSNKNSSVSVCILDILAVLNGSYRTFFQCIVNTEPRMFISNYALWILSTARNKSLPKLSSNQYWKYKFLRNIVETDKKNRSKQCCTWSKLGEYILHSCIWQKLLE